MSDERSWELAKRHAESSQRFDYFVTGVALSLVGWLGGRTGPIVLSSLADIVYLIALVCLLLAAFSGMKRLEEGITALRLNALALLGEETASARRVAVETPGMLLDAQTGEQLDRHELAASATEQLELAKEARSLMSATSKRSGAWYRTRDWLLLAGLFLLIVGRLLAGS